MARDPWRQHAPRLTFALGVTVVLLRDADRKVRKPSRMVKAGPTVLSSGTSATISLT